MAEPADAAVVALAVEALRQFGRHTLSRADAAELLGMWRHRGLLNRAQRSAVLDAFGPARPPIPDGIEAYAIGTRHAWL